MVRSHYRSENLGGGACPVGGPPEAAASGDWYVRTIARPERRVLPCTRARNDESATRTGCATVCRNDDHGPIGALGATASFGPGGRCPTMSTSDAPRSVGELLEFACGARDGADLRGAAMSLLEHVVGADGSFCGLLGDVRARPVTRGVDIGSYDRFLASADRYAPDLTDLASRCVWNGPTPVLGTPAERARERRGFYREILLYGGDRALLTFVTTRFGRPEALVHLAREGRAATFREQDADAIRGLVPAVSLVLAAASGLAGPTWMADDDEALSESERDVLDYLALGLTNREIALARGTSPNTVRNQVARILEKSRCANRAQVVAWASERGMLRGASQGTRLA